MEELQNVPQGSADGLLLNKKNFLLLFCSVVLGVLFNILFFKKYLGLSYPLFVIAFYGVFIWNLRTEGKLKFDTKWLLGIPIFALSFTYFFFANELFMALNFLAIPVLIVAHTILLTSNHQYRWFELGFLGDMMFSAIARPLVHFIKPFSLLKGAVRTKGEPGKYAVVGKVLLGLLISVPLIAVIVSLLASADEVFNHLMDQIPNLFADINLNEYFVRLLLIVFISCTLFSYIWSLFNQEMLKIRALENAPHTYRFLDPVIVITILALVDIIYILFTMIQFSYLFGSLSLGLPDNFTYAQYARRGFFELVAVTMINLCILLGTINLTKCVGKVAERITKTLNTILVTCTLIMLFSAHFRMSLYEEAYGYTYLRVLTHAFMVYLFVMLGVTLYKIWKEKISLLKAYIVISVIAFTVINYVNMDVMIAKKNIERYKVEKAIDIRYLTSLSDDAIPSLLDFLNSDLDSTSAKQLENMLFERKIRLEERSRAWQSFNLAINRARQRLEKVELTFDTAAAEQMRMNSYVEP